MIKQIIILLFVIISLGFNKSNFKKFIPPGTVQINDTLFADKTEISNLSWLEFELWAKIKYGKNSTEYIAALPDTTVWRNKYSFNEPYVKYYYRHPAYKDYPVVGISYEQAIEFCKWRTERVKDFLSKSKKYDQLNFYYRLPTKTEWEKMSYGGAFEFSNNGRNEKKQMKVNVTRDSILYKGELGYMNENADVTAPVYSYWKNFFGLYNMIGNVSEMIHEKGISKGGSWINNIEDCRVGKDISYSKPDSWLGFRCVCILK